MNSKKITMAEIAEKAGVSQATVSRALAGSDLIGYSVRQDIERIAKTLGYVRRSVRRHKERCILTVKLVLPPGKDRAQKLFFSLSDLVDGLRKGVRPASVNVLVENGGPDYNPYPHKKGGEVEAFVFAFHYPSTEALSLIQARGATAVTLNRSVEGIRQVVNHHAQAMSLITSHLLSKGVQDHCCFVSYQGFEDVTQARLMGFAEACEAQGISFDVEKDFWLAESPNDITSASIKKWYDAGVRTFVGMNDIVGALILQHAHHAGYRIPEDLRVTGCDNAPVRDVTVPSLTSVDLSMYDLAMQAGRSILSEVIDGKTNNDILLVPGKLIVGETT